MRILIADDHEVVRRGLCTILDSRAGLQVCGEAANGMEALQKTRELQPDLVIMAVSMPVLDGLSAVREIKKVMPGVPVLMLSMHDGREMVRASQAAGAQGFVTKTEVASILLTAVDALLEGRNFFGEGAG